MIEKIFFPITCFIGFICNLLNITVLHRLVVDRPSKLFMVIASAADMIQLFALNG